MNTFRFTLSVLAACAFWTFGRAQDPAPSSTVTDEAPPARESAEAPTPPMPAEPAPAMDTTTSDRLTLPPTPPVVSPKAVSDEQPSDTPKEFKQRSHKKARAVEIIFSEGAHPADATTREANVVFGRGRIDGTVDGDLNVVFSEVVLNGTVTGELNAVFSRVHKGPNAVVEGEVHNVFSWIGDEGDAAATMGSRDRWQGEIPEALHVWGEKALCLGRPLAFDGRLQWIWWIVLAATAFELVIALVFPRAVDRCAHTLVERPGGAVVSSLAVIFGLPLLMLLLALTGVGLLLWPPLMFVMFIALVFGKTSLQAFLGRPVAKLFGENVAKHPAVPMLIGAVFLTLGYAVPFIGFPIWFAAGWLALGMVAFSVFENVREGRARTAAPVPPPVPTTAAAVPPLAVAVSSGAPRAEDVPVSVATLPRAGFWVRFGASLIDAVAVSVVVAVLHNGAFFPLVFALYCTVMWATKGTTVGGIVFGLKIVRLDGRPLDWPVAVVRTLGGFLSLFVAGLGFFWVAIDRERQSWHDKIAGTTIVRMPKGVSLL